MVDILKLKARMVLAGYNQRTLTEECKKRGYKTSENTMNAKLNNRSPWTCADVDMVCDVLEIRDAAEKADIFLA
jgi:hypothetical protein